MKEKIFRKEIERGYGFYGTAPWFLRDWNAEAGEGGRMQLTTTVPWRFQLVTERFGNTATTCGGGNDLLGPELDR